jgi:5'-deoxynucleotidase YfbR-like HD superfamily hydrolase
VIEKYFCFLDVIKKGKSMKTEIEKMNEIFEGVISKNAYEFMRTTFFRVKTFECWRGRVNRSVLFYKEEKEALNAMVFCFLLMYEQEENGREINWDACIAYIITRMIRKSLTWDMKPGYKKRIQRMIGNFNELVQKYVHKRIKEKTGEDFVNAIYGLASEISEFEEGLYSIAKAYTNRIEYNFVESTIWYGDRNKIKREIDDIMDSVGSNQYITKELGRLISYISACRNSIRWQGCGSTLDCSILCHMFETAILAWFMAIENNQNDKNQKIVPYQAFLVGLYHDIPELWTDDIPSICKNEIGRESDQNLRPATEELEREVLEEHFYPVFPSNVREYLKKNIMLEELNDKYLHKLLKMADYLSADFECYWMIIQGSENRLYIDILRSSARSKRTCETAKLLKKMYFMSLFHIPRDP